MNILHLAMHDYSGAGRASVRLHNELLALQANSSILALHGDSNRKAVFAIEGKLAKYKNIQYELYLRLLNRLLHCQHTFSVNLSPSLIHGQIQKFRPDVIHLHWIGWEFLRIESLAELKAPIVWTLHDMWPFTGGCHYSGDCRRYTESCGHCPQINSSRFHDLSHRVWLRKSKAWQALDLTVIAPSEWMAECAKESSLFRNRRIEVIANGLDNSEFKPYPRDEARHRFGVPPDKKIILFGAIRASADSRKGFHLLQKALLALRETVSHSNIEVAVFGMDEPDEAIDFGFRTHYLGILGNDLLIQAYSAADVMVVPSIQESFGQTASEALSCGTPVVAFNATGLKDIVDHQANGYLAKAFEVEDLAKGILWILADQNRYSRLCLNARTKALADFSVHLQASKLLDLYQDVST